MLFDVYDLEWPACSSLPPLFGYCFSEEAARGSELGLYTGGRTRAERWRGIAQEGLCNERIGGTVVWEKEEE
jgi:hypothetical protein